MRSRLSISQAESAPPARRAGRARVGSLLACELVAVACGGAPTKDGGQGPVVCPHVGSAFSANAKFERQPDGELLMAVHLEPPPSSDLTFVDDEPFVQGATVVSHGRLGSALELRMRLDAGVTSPPITLNPPIQCRSGKDGLDVSLAWKTIEADAPVTVTIVDRR